MKSTNSQLKDIARANLLGNYSIPIFAWVFTTFVIMLIETPFSNMVTTGLENLSVYHMAVGSIGMFIVSLISVLFSAGCTNLHLKLARRMTYKFSDVFYPFKNHPDKFIGYGAIIVVISVVCLLPGVLCVTTGATLADTPIMIAGVVLMIAGIIVLYVFAFALSQTTYILLDHVYDVKVFEAMRMSIDLMKGNKMRLFILALSFIPWLLLGVASLGIGMLFVTPYMQQTMAQFYLDVKKESLPNIE